jgi:predicted dehydrogenase
MTERWINKACVVGLGPHALTKLIPALQANDQEITAVVTSQKVPPVAGARLFARLDEACQALPSDVVFVVASPPIAHFVQAETILGSGHDVFIEKPAFATVKEVESIAEMCDRQGVVLLEGFMHRYTAAYERLIAYWRANAGDIVALTSKFLIPEVRSGSFRDDPAIASSIVYDIGCYPVSLLVDLDSGAADLEIADAVHAGNQARERIHVTGKSGRLDVDIEIGMADAYANWMELRRKSGETLRIHPFFYGRSGARTIVAADRSETIEEGNAFERMFRLSREDLVISQQARFRAMVAATGLLAGLGTELQIARREALRG